MAEKKFTFKDYQDFKYFVDKEYYYYTHINRNSEEDKQYKYYSQVKQKIAKFENDTIKKAFEDYDIQKDIFIPLWAR